MKLALPRPYNYMAVLVSLLGFLCSIAITLDTMWLLPPVHVVTRAVTGSIVDGVPILSEHMILERDRDVPVRTEYFASIRTDNTSRSYRLHDSTRSYGRDAQLFNSFTLPTTPSPIQACLHATMYWRNSLSIIEREYILEPKCINL